jgi:iron complex outermembrane receptor protein
VRSAEGQRASDGRREDLGATARASMFGAYCSIDSAAPANDQTFGSEWVFDFELSYQIGKAVLAAGVQNLFDNFPDKNLPANFNFGIFTYPRNAPFGFNGRYVYLRTGYTF